MPELTAQQAGQCIPAREFYEVLGEAADRAADTIRRRYKVAPYGYVYNGGRATHYYTKQQMTTWLRHLRDNPPEGSGRPKGSTTKNEKRKP